MITFRFDSGDAGPNESYDMRAAASGGPSYNSQPRVILSFSFAISTLIPGHPGTILGLPWTRAQRLRLLMPSRTVISIGERGYVASS